MTQNISVHPSALVETRQLGDGTRIWAFVHVLEGAVIGKSCNIGDHCYIESGVTVGDGVTLKNGVALWEGVTLEDFVFVGPYVVFTNDCYPRSARGPAVGDRQANREWLQPTLVREGASLGANATLLSGVTVGTYAMVAAGAVVVDDVPDLTLVKGAPARAAGHVCMCGQPLPARASPECAVCGRAYRSTDVGLSLAQ